MNLFNRKLYLLASIAILLVLMVIDISYSKISVVEAFLESFIDEEKTLAAEKANVVVKKTITQNLEFSSQGIKEIFLSNQRGNIVVGRAANAEIILQSTVTAAARDSAKANQLLDQFEVRQQETDGRVTLGFDEEGKRISEDALTIDYTLLIPDGIRLQLENISGNIAMNEVQTDAEVRSEYGMTSIHDVRGKLSLSSMSGSLYVSGVAGSMDLVNELSTVTIEHVKGDVVISDENGDSFISNIEGSVTGEARHGVVHIREIAGPVEIDIYSANLRLDHIRNHLRVKAKLGETRIILPESEGYSLDVKSDGGYIRSQLPIPIERIERDFRHEMKGIVGDGTWEVDVDASTSDIIIHEGGGPL